MFGQATYLIFEVAWALPVLLIQWAAGWAVLWRQRQRWIVSLIVPTLYLCIADRIAIAEHIWQINLARSTGWRPFGLPIEEAIFFLVTNAMVVQTVILVRYHDDVWLVQRLRRRLQRRPLI